MKIIRQTQLAILLLSTCGLYAQAAPVPLEQRIAHGEYLSRAGDCTACHTAVGGQPFSGGLKMTTPVGAIYSTNITPDKEQGIGEYSFTEFSDAVRKGIRKDGTHLYPAMPYPSFVKINEDDMQDLYLYFQHGVKPVAQANKDSDIP
ncbi:MAG: c-type cytochrome, partial [Enterobacterales bacterium]|nr:c-type cytochrome [Enterobacterales bacterium]